MIRMEGVVGSSIYDIPHLEEEESVDQFDEAKSVLQVEFGRAHIILIQRAHLTFAQIIRQNLCHHK